MAEGSPGMAVCWRSAGRWMVGEDLLFDRWGNPRMPVPCRGGAAAVESPAMLGRIRDIAARLEYWTMRSLRRATPQALVDGLLDRGLFLQPGRETSAPRALAEDYARRAEGLGVSLADADVFVVGFGGSYGIGVHLLELGARRVVLQDPFAPERSGRNDALPREVRERYREALATDRLAVVHEHVHDHAAGAPRTADLVLSHSVLEHVSDLDALVKGCRAFMRPDGANIHSIDLRDHYFRYPFEMLCYSEYTWRHFLNASNNLNRLRIPDYERIFAAHFDQVTIEPFLWLRDEFRASKARIRPEFLSGDDEVDAVGEIWLEARQTIPPQTKGLGMDGAW